MYRTTDQAQLAGNSLNGYESEKNRPEVGLAESLVRGGRRSRPEGGSSSGAAGGSSRTTDFPLRMLVHSNMVGAIIGYRGSTIRLITQQSRTKAHIQYRDYVAFRKKVIIIHGKPKNCTNTCKWILEVMELNADDSNPGKILLQILAHHSLIGCIFGVGGNTIKRIQQETNTKIMISSINDMNIFNLQRIITVKGSIENIAKAQSIIYSKLHQNYKHNPEETTYIHIPNYFVGAIVGRKGSYIQHIIRFSAASIQIVPLDQDMENQPDATETRKVTIVGRPEAQWKAQRLIVKKMREKGLMYGNDDVMLTVERVVASSQAGYIIDNAGQRMRELERLTGTRIMVRDLPRRFGQESEREISVHIMGSFNSVQMAQVFLRGMMPNANAPSRHRRIPQPWAMQQ